MPDDGGPPSPSATSWTPSLSSLQPPSCDLLHGSGHSCCSGSRHPHAPPPPPHDDGPSAEADPAAAAPAASTAAAQQQGGRAVGSDGAEPRCCDDGGGSITAPLTSLACRCPAGGPGSSSCSSSSGHHIGCRRAHSNGGRAGLKPGQRSSPAAPSRRPASPRSSSSSPGSPRCGLKVGTPSAAAAAAAAAGFGSAPGPYGLKGIAPLISHHATVKAAAAQKGLGGLGAEPRAATQAAVEAWMADTLQPLDACAMCAELLFTLPAGGWAGGCGGHDLGRSRPDGATWVAVTYHSASCPCETPAEACQLLRMR